MEINKEYASIYNNIPKDDIESNDLYSGGTTQFGQSWFVGNEEEESYQESVYTKKTKLN